MDVRVSRGGTRVDRSCKRGPVLEGLTPTSSSPQLRPRTEKNIRGTRPDVVRGPRRLYRRGVGSLVSGVGTHLDRDGRGRGWYKTSRYIVSYFARPTRKNF